MLRRAKKQGPRIFFATDVHGSETCFRKFVNAAAAYSADVIIMGGDITGKQLVLIVAENGGWRLGAGQNAERFGSQEELDGARKRLSAQGLYPIVVAADEELALTSSRDAIEQALCRRARRARRVVDGDRQGAAGAPGDPVLHQPRQR